MIKQIYYLFTKGSIPKDTFNIANTWKDDKEKIFQIRTGGNKNFGYVYQNEDYCLAIDFGHGHKNLIKNFDITEITSTHTHFDHASKNQWISKKTNAPVVISPSKNNITFLKTPGHTECSKCFIINNKFLITGDTLFIGKIGGTWTKTTAKTQFESLRKLMELNDNLIILPGHDFGEKPFDTLGNQKRTNPFLLRLDNFDDFYSLKKNWKQYKKENALI